MVIERVKIAANKLYFVTVNVIKRLLYKHDDICVLYPSYVISNLRVLNDWTLNRSSSEARRLARCRIVSALPSDLFESRLLNVHTLSTAPVTST